MWEGKQLTDCKQESINLLGTSENQAARWESSEKEVNRLQVIGRYKPQSSLEQKGQKCLQIVLCLKEILIQLLALIMRFI